MLFSLKVYVLMNPEMKLQISQNGLVYIYAALAGFVIMSINLRNPDSPRFSLTYVFKVVLADKSFNRTHEKPRSVVKLS